MRTILVTGGAGFIGSCFVRQCLSQRQVRVVNFDKLTYAGNLDSLDALPPPSRSLLRSRRYRRSPDRGSNIRRLSARRYRAFCGRIACGSLDRRSGRVRADKRPGNFPPFGLRPSLPRPFARRPDRETFRFLHVSTDEVFGSLGSEGRFHRIESIRSQFAVFGLESVGRSFCPSLFPHLSFACLGD